MRFHYVAVLLCSVVAPPTRAEPTTTSTTSPTTSPTANPAVSAMLAATEDAYRAVESLQLEGTITLDSDIAGSARREQVAFTSSFKAPNRFRHEIKDDVLLVSDGAKAFAFLPARARYIEAEAAAARGEVDNLSGPISDILSEQNPALLLAIAGDASRAVLRGATAIALDPADPSALTLLRDDRPTRVVIDPKTHFIKQVVTDLREHLARQGAADVKRATVTIDYTRVEVTPVVDDVFAWSPPVGATRAHNDGGAGDDPPMALIGKSAPDFALKGIDGKTVALSQLKGKVVVLDFFATWCGPCVASLPGLEKLAQDKSEAGMVLIAIDSSETKAVIAKYFAQKQLSMIALLDADGKVAEKYNVSGIPQTVVIGKDGKVLKVFVGFGGDHSELTAAVDDAISAAP